LLIVCLTGCESTPREAVPPNFVLIVVDDLRADHLTSYGYERDTTPFLATLGERGVVFDKVVSHSSWTKSAMASLVSSLNPDAHLVRSANDVLSEDVDLLPEVLRERGYRTFGVHGNPWMESRFGFNQGYDAFIYAHWHNDGIDAQRVVREALDWLGTSDEPFFMYLHFMDVHSPFIAPEGYEMFGKEGLDGYDGSIRYVDDQLEHLYGELQSRGILDHTWLVFTSDHGEEFGEHGTPDHGHGVTLYREVLDVPLILHHRRETPTTRRLSRQVRLIDVAPTILDLADIAPPSSMQGQSLKADLRGEGPGDDWIAVSRVGGNAASPDSDLFSFTTPRFKYIVDFWKDTEELYDLRTDPSELNNIVEEQPEAAARLREQALRHRDTLQSAAGDAGGTAEIDDELRERLRALGYLK